MQSYMLSHSGNSHDKVHSHRNTSPNSLKTCPKTGPGHETDELNSLKLTESILADQSI